jgi:hypothetical protein
MEEGSRFAPRNIVFVPNNGQISINNKENYDEETFTT